MAENKMKYDKPGTVVIISKCFFRAANQKGEVREFHSISKAVEWAQST